MLKGGRSVSDKEKDMFEGKAARTSRESSEECIRFDTS